MANRLSCRPSIFCAIWRWRNLICIMFLRFNRRFEDGKPPPRITAPAGKAVRAATPQLQWRPLGGYR
jgi:hypothetical protein